MRQYLFLPILGSCGYDYEAAQRACLDFVFVSGWTEFQDWKNFVDVNGIESLTFLDEILNVFENL